MREEDAHAGGCAQGSKKTPKIRGFQRALLAWYEGAKRDLPWRHTGDPYAIWLSEVMLQQTRVETVIPYYARFLARYPTVHALAAAPLDDVLTMWSGLGYYRRARMLHAGAQHVAETMGGAFPGSADLLREIPGIGPYTAGAVASIAFGQAEALVDGNVARVLARVFAVREDVRGGAGLARIWSLARELVSDASAAPTPGAWNQALMELGATVCAPREPRCGGCPVRLHCQARTLGIEASLPQLKAKPKPLAEARVAVVATKDGAVLLARRQDDARFGGMWEPPSVHGAAIEPLAALLGVRFRNVSPCGEVVHVLSHRRLSVAVVRARLSRAPAAGRVPGGDYGRLALVSAGDLGGYALTMLARKILAAAQFA